jgi:hypothetical protein
MSQMHVDPATGRRFYVDAQTGQSRWADDVAVHSPGLVVAQTPSMPAQHVRAAGPVYARFQFDGGAGGYLGISILAFLIIVCTLGLLAPFGMVLRYRWRAEHTLLDGHRVRFTGSATGLFGTWIKMWLLCLVTMGIYGFWVAPRLIQWVVEHQEIAYSGPARTS